MNEFKVIKKVSNTVIKILFANESLRSHNIYNKNIFLSSRQRAKLMMIHKAHSKQLRGWKTTYLALSTSSARAPNKNS